MNELGEVSYFSVFMPLFLFKHVYFILLFGSDGGTACSASDKSRSSTGGARTPPAEPEHQNNSKTHAYDL